MTESAGTRRAFVLLLSSLILPGSAQFMVGNRRVGIIAMSLWTGLLTVLLLALWIVRPDRAAVINALTNPTALYVGRLAVVLVLICWLVALVDTWRLALQPLAARWRLLLVSVTNLVIVSMVMTIVFFGWQAVSASRHVVNEVFDSTAEVPPLNGRYNIVLLGVDSAHWREGVRPDSMNVISVDASTGKSVMISLPRNLQNVPFPEDSPMHAVYPYGYNCGAECMLNAVHTEASARPDLYPGVDDPGLQATIEAIEGATGLETNYYIMVNMAGFASLVDAVGGIKMNVREPIAKFGSVDAVQDEYIPAGLQTLNGEDALWYARSRVQSDDYERMGRQKCLIQGMIDQLSPQRVILNAGEIAESSADMISTDIPGSTLGQFGDLALKSRSQAIPTLSIVPPEYSGVAPDYEQIHADIAELIRESETPSTPEPTTPAPTTAASDDQLDPTPSPTPTGGAAANNTEDLSSVC